MLPLYKASISPTSALRPVLWTIISFGKVARDIEVIPIRRSVQDGLSGSARLKNAYPSPIKGSAKGPGEKKIIDIYMSSSTIPLSGILILWETN